MAIQTLPEKLQLKDEKNLLVQGLPSSIEKQFVKFSFAKNVTPLLKSRKIDFALIFAISQKQLKEILADVLPALHKESKLWIAYPKLTSKIASDLSRDANWDCVTKLGYESVRAIALDHVWTAIRFKKPVEEEQKKENFSAKNPAPGIDFEKRTIQIPTELNSLLSKSKPAHSFFETLSFTNKREYVEWIVGAKKEETKAKRLTTIIEKLVAGETRSVNWY
jgi:Bacteriocin-protection, YdeI or OmpD-Associated